MNFKLLFLFLAMAVTFATVASAVKNKGAEELQLPGGVRGNVPFPHHRHQDVLVDCNICHALFPQQKGVIAKLKSEGKLDKKYVMNRLCTKCHREKIRAGQKSGPISCSDCHIK
ncbi:MAG: cytochrome c3 family protein [Desulfobacterales bacterium]|jgi:hypothetical protein